LGSSDSAAEGWERVLEPPEDRRVDQVEDTCSPILASWTVCGGDDREERRRGGKGPCWWSPRRCSRRRRPGLPLGSGRGHLSWRREDCIRDPTRCPASSLRRRGEVRGEEKAHEPEELRPLEFPNFCLIRSLAWGRSGEVSEVVGGDLLLESSLSRHILTF
jgi:hypothetical protein